MNTTTETRTKSLHKYFCCFLFLSAVFFYFSSDRYFSVFISNGNREKIQLFRRTISGINITSQKEYGEGFRPLLVYETRNTHCFVTAFMDMKRDFWNGTLERTNREYLSRFRRLMRLREPLVVFIDDTLLKEVNTIVYEDRPPGVYTLIIPIDRMFLYENIYSWSLINREKEIMESIQYRSLLPPHLRHLPEHNIPEYTLMNHAKIDFINYVISHIHNEQYDRYVWIDFGYLHQDNLVPKKPFRTDFLSNNTITYMALKRPTRKDGDPFHSLLHPSQTVTGGFFTGTIILLKNYQKKIS